MNAAQPEGVPQFGQLSESEQRQVAERLLKIQESGWRPFWCPDSRCSGSPHQMHDPGDGEPLWMPATAQAGPNDEPLGDPVEFPAEGEYPATILRPILDPRWAHNHARVDQRLPPWSRPWVVGILSGRGSGKTTTGTEFITLNARRKVDTALVARRGTELANTHIKTILERAHPEFVPEWSASKDILTWPNGATTFCFSAERPENIRSINIGAWWIDEAAFMDEIETVWMNLRLATRVADPRNPIHGLITSTPTPTPFMMRLEDDETIEVRRVSTYANRANLSADFIAMLEREYEGTRMGRQELYGEVLRDVEGALWNDDMFHHLRVESAARFEELLDSMDDRVLAVDPAGSKGPRSDATGIIGMGLQHTNDGGRFYVLGDATIKGTPTEWAAQTFKAARLWNVNRIVVERNFGGDMVKQALNDYACAHPNETCDAEGNEFRITESRAVTGKETRAEPLVGRYERGAVIHVTSPNVFGDLSLLEKEQATWVPKSRGGKSPSPNRVDAEVWCHTSLQQQVRYAAAQATSRDVMRRLKR